MSRRLEAIHRSAWKEDPANFRFTAVSRKFAIVCAPWSTREYGRDKRPDCLLWRPKGVWCSQEQHLLLSSSLGHLGARAVRASLSCYREEVPHIRANRTVPQTLLVGRCG
jgi:hypothetical protein